MKTTLLALAALFLLTSTVSAADPVKVGFISVLSGPLAPIGNSELNATKMAVEDYGPVLGQKAQLFPKDHNYNPGLANERAKELYEKDNVDAIVACSNSAAALAVSDQAERHKRIFMSTSAGTTDLIGKNRYTFKMNYNDFMLANTVGRWGAKNLGKRWYTITSDYAWGHDLLKHFTNALKEEGGTHVGNDMVPVNTSDYSPYILKAAQAKPDVLVLLNVGKDAANSTKAAVEYGLRKSVKIVHALLFELDIKGAGLETFVGDYTAAPWNWVVNQPGSREWADRYYKAHGDRPTFMAAAAYDATWQYLDAVKRANSQDPDKVIKALEGHTFKNFFTNPGYIRPSDHLEMTNAFLLRVKQPDQVKEKEDYFEVVGTLAADKAQPPVGLFKTIK
ncbi:MAG TPA: ABC transporter substrate-binding protein [Desulfatiglandales bacterium]|nr:ABC transporter substrate-binding protein [Desulfatiglandales bacterium]